MKQHTLKKSEGQRRNYREMREHLEMNENEKATFPNLPCAVKAVREGNL